jgi:hypothetical protein
MGARDEEGRAMRFGWVLGAALFGVSMMLPLSAQAYSTLAASEETPPAACDIGDSVYGAQCYGSNCDNTRLYCSETNYAVTRRYWTSNFSEEGTYWRYCGSNEIMTGISCSGRYCDNVSIECSRIPRTRYNCSWSLWHSEEQGALYFAGKFANGMACNGGNCDNHQYYVCNY